MEPRYRFLSELLLFWFFFFLFSQRFEITVPFVFLLSLVLSNRYLVHHFGIAFVALLKANPFPLGLLFPLLNKFLGKGYGLLIEIKLDEIMSPSRP